MKKFVYAVICLIVGTGLMVSSMDAKKTEAEKQREKTEKNAQKAYGKKAVKEAKKEAKTLTKGGWRAAAGALPLEKQLDRSYMMLSDFSDEGEPKYLSASGQAVGGSFEAAKMQALELAKQDIASQIQTKMTALVESTIQNDQREDGEVVSQTLTSIASKNLINQNLGQVNTVVEAYRMVGKNYEVMVRVFYNSATAQKVAKSVIKKELENRGDSLHKELDRLAW